jgi:cytochrome c oxidase assembly factor CtaG
VAIIAYVGVYAWRFRKARAERAAGGLEWWRVAAFAAGIACLVVALMSPVEELGEHYLFSAHMLQHILIGDLAPLLIVLGLSRVIMRPATRRLTRLEQALGPFAHPLTALLLWIALIYVWHIPALYDGALEHPLVHGVEHLCFFIGGFLLWWPLIQPVPMRRQMSGMWPFAYITAAKVALGVLGVLFLWSSVVLYDFYEHVPRIWGLTPLDDQKVGGALMMAEQSIVLFAVFFVLFIRMLARSEEEQLRIERLEAAGAVEPVEPRLSRSSLS